ncbi:hypothetical protein [Shouchella clausii]|uniref:hypothetical protein n=1 Tax=Shouchella clausii TaxID=79880 RepID=UPI001C72E465|nr:hypothetical protein [Shouchella clausii]MBX0320332.1 hypothetical protein [Shouchella clausii]
MESSKEIERILNYDSFIKKRNSHGKYRSHGKMITAYDLVPKDKLASYTQSQKPDLDNIFSRIDYLDLDKDNQKELLIKWKEKYSVEDICSFPKWNKINLYKEAKLHNVEIEEFEFKKNKNEGDYKMNNAAKARQAAANAKPLKQEELNYYKQNHKNFPSHDKWMNTRTTDKRELIAAWDENGVTPSDLVEHLGKDRSYWQYYFRNVKKKLEKVSENQSSQLNLLDKTQTAHQERKMSVKEESLSEYGMEISFNEKLFSSDAINRLKGVIALIESTGGQFELDISVKEVKTDEADPLLDNRTLKELASLLQRRFQK